MKALEELYLGCLYLGKNIIRGAAKSKLKQEWEKAGKDLDELKM